jgi:hypothetical protein
MTRGSVAIQTRQTGADKVGLKVSEKAMWGERR